VVTIAVVPGLHVSPAIMYCEVTTHERALVLSASKVPGLSVY